MPDQPTLTDRLIARLKNNPVLSVVIVIAVIVMGVASFLNAIGDIRTFLGGETPEPVAEAPTGPTGAPTAPPEAAPVEGPAQAGVTIGDNDVTFGGAYTSTNLQGYDPTWSGDGRMIVYCARNYSSPTRHGSDLMVSSDGGRTGTVLLSSETAKFQPQVSFDGRYVAFLAAEQAPEYRWNGRGSLWVMPVTGGAPVRASGPHGAVVFDLNYITNFDWSPIRNQLAYVQEEVVSGRTFFGLYVYDVQDRQSRLLHRFDPATDFGELWAGRELSKPQWSPDGQRLGVVYGGGGEHLFFYMDVDGGAPIQAEPVTATAMFDWYDSNTIVYDAGGAGVYRLAMYEIGAPAPTYFSRYEYFFSPVVTRTTSIIFFGAQFELADGRWRHGAYLLRTPSDEPRAVVEVIRSDFDGPIAQRFQDREDEPRATDVPSYLRLDNAGQRGLYAIEEQIFMIDMTAS